MHTICDSASCLHDAACIRRIACRSTHTIMTAAPLRWMHWNLRIVVEILNHLNYIIRTLVFYSGDSILSMLIELCFVYHIVYSGYNITLVITWISQTCNWKCMLHPWIIQGNQLWVHFCKFFLIPESFTIETTVKIETLSYREEDEMRRVGW